MCQLFSLLGPLHSSAVQWRGRFGRMRWTTHIHGISATCCWRCKAADEASMLVSSQWRLVWWLSATCRRAHVSTATGCIKPSRIQGLMSRSGPRFDVDVSASSCRVNFLASSRIAHQHLHPVSAHGGPTECLGPSKIVVDLHKKNQWASSLTGPKSLFWSGPQTVARPLHMACTAENPFLQQRNPNG